MAIVFRVESETKKATNTTKMGSGVYRCDAGLILAEGEDDRHPLPQHDMKLSKAMARASAFSDELSLATVRECSSSGAWQDFNFCFESEEALLRWFSGLRKESCVSTVQELCPDMCIAAYRSDEVIHGSFQSIIRGDTAELIERYPLDKYL